MRKADRKPFPRSIEVVRSPYEIEAEAVARGMSGAWGKIPEHVRRRRIKNVVLVLRSLAAHRGEFERVVGFDVLWFGMLEFDHPMRPLSRLDSYRTLAHFGLTERAQAKRGLRAIDSKVLADWMAEHKKKGGT
jgi:hypothetical protein